MQRELLIAILGPAVCHVCLNPRASALHRELCITRTEGS
jgi:hypothetical protein